MERKPLPPEREVDCACASPLQRRVLDRAVNVTACLRCGAVSVFEPIVYARRPHDVRCDRNEIVAIATIELAWLAAWPRAAEAALLPASLRAADAGALARAEAAEQEAQQGLAPRERFLRAGFPSEAPPPLPFRLSAFAETWHGLQLTAGSTFDELMGHAGRGFGARFAHALLARRPAIAHELAALVRWDVGRRAAALYAIERLRLADERVLAALRERLAVADPREAYALLAAVDALGPAARPLAPSLRGLAERTADYYDKKRVEASLRRLL